MHNSDTADNDREKFSLLNYQAQKSFTLLITFIQASEMVTSYYIQ